MRVEPFLFGVFFFFAVWFLSKPRLFERELVIRWVITAVRWVKISGMLEDGNGSSNRNRWSLMFLFVPFWYNATSFFMFCPFKFPLAVFGSF